jgi:hypothetical protein
MRTRLTVFAACLLIVPAVVWGQGLVANPNPLTINVPFGSSTTSQVVNITNNGSVIAITNVSTSGQSWLSAFISNTGVVTVSANPSGLSGSYLGTVFVTTAVGSLSFQVNLNVGTGGGTTGLMAVPNPLTFSLPSGTTPLSAVVNITFNGSPVTITGISSSTNTGQNWLQASSQSGTSVLVTVNPSGLSGTNFGTVAVITTNGPINFQVNLTVGTSPPPTPAPSSLILILTGLVGVGLYQMKWKRVGGVV